MAEQAAVRARIGETPLSELPSLAAWRRAFRSFGVDPLDEPKLAALDHRHFGLIRPRHRDSVTLLP